LSHIVDCELLRDDLARAVPRSDGSKGGRPPFDLVVMFKVLILQASHSLSDERDPILIEGRLSFMRFLGLGLSDPVPDAKTTWAFREALTRAEIARHPAIEVLFSACDTALRQAGVLALGAWSVVQVKRALGRAWPRLERGPPPREWPRLAGETAARAARVAPCRAATSARRGNLTNDQRLGLGLACPAARGSPSAI